MNAVIAAMANILLDIKNTARPPRIDVNRG